MRSLNLKRASSGFTLIELIITIVIIGVLAAVAIPKFLDLSSDAEKGVAAGIGSSLASATSVNYSRSKVPGAVACTSTVTTNCYYTLATCDDVNTHMAALADIPAGYSVIGGTTALTTGVATSGCSVKKTAGTATAAFNAYGT